MDKLGLNLGYLLVQIFNFGVLFIILRKWVFVPVMGLLEKRRETIAQGLEDARVAGEARANAEKEAQSVLAEAQKEANAKVREANERAEEIAREVRSSAESEAAALRQDAKEAAGEATSQALAELRPQIAALAIAAAQKLIGEALDEKRQHALIQEFFSGIEAGEVVLLKGEKLSGAGAEVTSAVTLTADEQRTVTSQLQSKLSAEAAVTFKQDPAILGGLVIRVGDRVLDGSVVGKLEGLRQSLR